MQNQKMINLLNNSPNQPPKFKTKNWVKINDESRGMYNKNIQVRFKTSMLRSSLPIKNLSTFWRTRKMPLINCEINLSKLV